MVWGHRGNGSGTEGMVQGQRGNGSGTEGMVQGQRGNVSGTDVYPYQYKVWNRTLF